MKPTRLCSKVTLVNKTPQSADYSARFKIKATDVHSHGEGKKKTHSPQQKVSLNSGEKDTLNRPI